MMTRKWYDAIEEVVLLTVLLQTCSSLNWPFAYLLTGLIAILNIPSLFPLEDLRYFESCRARASPGFCVSSVIVQMLVASLIDVHASSGMLSLGCALSSTLSFAFCQIVYSSLFSGLSIPLPITGTMFTVPCIIASQVVAAANGYEWEDVVEVAVVNFATLVLVDLLQTVFPRSFTAGESFLVSSLLVQTFRWISAFTLPPPGEATDTATEATAFLISAGLSFFIATAVIVSIAHVTRKERNSSPKLTRGDCQLAVVFYSAIALCLVMAPSFAAILNFPPPIQWLFVFLYSCLDAWHFALLSLWCSFSYLAYLVVCHHTKQHQSKEFSNFQRKTFHVIGACCVLAGIWIDLTLTGLVTFALLILFCWTSLYSAYQIYPFGGQTRRVIMVMVDHRDGGKIVLTPIYLLFGLAIPLWIDMARHGGICSTSTFVGISALGFGDTAASLIGMKYGKYRIFQNEKSIEGLLANLGTQLLFYWVVSLLTSRVALTAGLILSLYLSSMLEAATDQIDNLVLPLFLYPMVSLTA